MKCPECKSINLVTEYLSERINYGGIMTRRVDVIKDLKEKGGTPRMIDAYMMGADLVKEKMTNNKLH